MVQKTIVTTEFRNKLAFSFQVVRGGWTRPNLVQPTVPTLDKFSTWYGTNTWYAFDLVPYQHLVWLRLGTVPTLGMLLIWYGTNRYQHLVPSRSHQMLVLYQVEAIPKLMLVSYQVDAIPSIGTVVEAIPNVDTVRRTKEWSKI